MVNTDFYGFPSSSKEDWIQKVNKDLRGKSFEDTLHSKLWGEIEIEPMYFDSGINARQTFHSQSSIPGTNPREWNNLVAVSVDDAKESNERILNLLNSGADGIILEVANNCNLSQVLTDVLPEYIKLYFFPKGDLSSFQDSLKTYVDGLEDANRQLNGGILWSPTTEAIKEGKANPYWDVANSYIKTFGSLDNFYPLTIDMGLYAEAGANGIQELTFGLSELIENVDYLTKAGNDLEFVLKNIQYMVSSGSEFFGHIAKIKALRSLCSDLALTYGIKLNGENINLIAYSSDFTKTVLDPYSNLIRQTYEGMSAIIGGCNSLWIKPMEGNKGGELFDRMALNVSTVLKDESHLDKVMDPSSGSSYLDKLQECIIDVVKNRLTDLEESGGWLQNFKDGKIQFEVRHERNKSQNAVLASEVSKIGANKYLSPELRKEDIQFQVMEESELQLKPSRASFLSEKQFVDNEA